MVARATTPTGMAITPSSKDLTKSSPTLPLLHLQLHQNRRRRSPLRAIASSAVAASIGRPFRFCRRRLAKLFARLATSLQRRAGAPGTPKPKLSRRPGFRRRVFLSPLPSSVAPTNPTLPAPSDPRRRTVFLDLDETLVHSSTDQQPDAGPNSCDFIVQPVIDGRVLTFYVRKRPGVDAFVAALASRYEVVVFTAGLREYASLVLERLDPGGTLFAHRLYRDACREADGGRLAKDLSVVGRDLARAVLVDDNPNSYVFQPENALPVAPFLDDPNDQELQRLGRFFDEVFPLFEDARDAVRWFRTQSDDKDGGVGGGAGREGEKKMLTTDDNTTSHATTKDGKKETHNNDDENQVFDITFTSRQKALQLRGGRCFWDCRRP